MLGADNSVPVRPFVTTRWDLIDCARDKTRSQQARRRAAYALDELCSIYRAPIVAYLQRFTATAAEAEDIAQEFLARRVSPELLAGADAEKGRFRSLLLTALKNFLRDHVRRQRAVRRGGKITLVELEEAADAADDRSAAAERLFDRAWADTVVGRALARIEREFAERGGSATYRSFLPFIARPAGQDDLAAIAARLGLRYNTAEVRLSRLRAIYARYVREELARTVAAPHQVESETQYLVDVLADAA